MKVISFTSRLLLLSPLTVLANDNPWLITPGDSHIQTSYIYQSNDEFYLGQDKNTLPDDLTQHSAIIQFSHGLSDNLAIDISTGYSSAEFEPQDDDSGIIDSKIGLSWRFHDEFIEDGLWPSAAVRVGAIIAGDYETGQIYSIGDGADAVEASLNLGRVFNSYFALSGNVGLRFREDDVPNERFLNLNSHFTVTPTLSLSAGYHLVDSRGNLDIGGPGFSPDRFPETEEDSEVITLGANVAIDSSISLGVTYGEVIDGRNTLDAQIISASVGISF